ncbi:nuclease-related domain-containing protein, partial [Zunongwangia atlantica]
HYGRLIHVGSDFIMNVVIPRMKGNFGERRVAAKLRRLRKRDYIVLNNILIPSGQGSSQIDHIVICSSGVFVIETKHYKGWIHGHQKSENWSQTIFKHHTRFKNPIRQNWTHIFALRKLHPNFQKLKYYPIVVFSGRARLKNVTSELPVLYLWQLIRYIRTENHRNQLSPSQMLWIAEIIKSKNLKKRKDRKIHNRHIKMRIKDQKIMAHLKICPRCQGDLLLKNGRYGNFYGCSNYPKCTYTKKLLVIDSE